MTDDEFVSGGVERRATSTLRPPANAAAEHTTERVAHIAAHIQDYGWGQPIVIDGDGEISSGHGRYLAAEHLGLDRIPVIVHEGETDG